MQYTQGCKFVYLSVYIASSSNLLLLAIVPAAVVVLLLITCVAVLVLVLAVIVKRKKLRTKKAHTDQPVYYNETRGREGKTIEELYDDVEEGPSKTERQCGLYQELDLGTVEERQYNCLTKKDSSAKDKAGRGEYSRRNDTMYTMYI